MEEIFNPATMNPTIIYLALLAGLWIAVTAAHVAGTGVLEIAALALLISSLYALVQMPTANWTAVLALIGGAGCFLVVPFVRPRLARWAELGLLLQAVGGIMLFSDRLVSPLMVAVTVGLAWIYNRFVLVPILLAHRKPGEYDDANEVIGVRGRVQKALDPVGAVLVNSEIWTARGNEYIPVGVEVIVTGKRGLELTVEKAKRDEPVTANGNGHH
jgi:membrane-bound ClpP family serine protease